MVFFRDCARSVLGAYDLRSMTYEDLPYLAPASHSHILNSKLHIKTHLEGNSIWKGRMRKIMLVGAMDSAVGES